MAFKYWGFTLVAAAIFALVPVGVRADELDCTKASSDVEATICQSETIRRLDGELAGVYESLQRDTPDPGGRESLRRGQQAWLAEVRDKCSDELCLLDVYKVRIKSLRVLAQLVDPYLPKSPEPLSAQASTPDAAVSSALSNALPAAAPPQQSPQPPVPSAPSTPSGSANPVDVAIGVTIILGLLAALAGLMRWLFRKLGPTLGRIRTRAPASPDGLAAARRALSGGAAMARKSLAGVQRHVWIGVVAGTALLFVHWLLAVIYCGIHMALGYARHCPGCRRMFSREEGYCTVIGVDSGYETVMRRDDVRAKTGTFTDESVGTIVRYEQVHVTYTTRRHEYHCLHCTHRWTEKSVSKS
jgi:uncharacterized protein